MPNELITDKIFLNKKAGRESTQILLEGDMIVPDIKPDMSSLLQTEANIIIDKTEVMQDRINFVGHLDLHVLYIAKASSNLVYGIDHVAQVDNFLNIDGVSSEMHPSLYAKINKIDYKMLNDRKINYRAVIDIFAEVHQEYELEVVTGIKDIPVTQLLKKKLNINRLVESRNDRFIVKDELNLNSGKPNIREFLQTSVDIITRDAKSGNGKVTTSGELLLKSLYKGDTEENLIEIVEHEIPFNGVFDVPKAKDYMIADVKLYVQDKHIQVKTNSDGEDRILDAEIFIGANIKINSEEESEILDDAYHTDQKLELIRENIKFPNIICKNKTQAPIKEIVQLDNNCPDILQVLRVNAHATIDDNHIIDDKVIVEGVINTEILYIAQSDDTPLYLFKTVLPYRQTIETKGAVPSMEAMIDITTEYISANLLSNNEIELRFLLSFNTYVKHDDEAEVIININSSPIDKEILDNMPSIVVCITEQQDTLWKIAKKYNINIEDLKRINDLEDDKIYPGQKLLILKTVKV